MSAMLKLSKVIGELSRAKWNDDLFEIMWILHASRVSVGIEL